MSTLKDSILTVGSGAHPTPFALEEATPYQDEEDNLTLQAYTFNFAPAHNLNEKISKIINF